MAYPLSASECRLVIEHSPVMVWRSGLDANCDYFNDMWLSFTGRTLVQEMGDGWAEGVHPDDVERCIAHYFDHFRRREPFDLEYRLRRHDGVYRWIFDRGVPFDDDAGAFGGFIGSCIDVDDRRKAQTAQEQHATEEATRRRYSTFFSNAAGGSWTWMQLYRVALLSGLSGALADDVMQPLTSILANAQAGQRLISRDAPDLVELQTILEDIAREDRRAAEIIGRLRILLREIEDAASSGSSPSAGAARAI